MNIVISGATGSVGESIINKLRSNYPNANLFGLYNSSNFLAQSLSEKYNVKMIQLKKIELLEKCGLPEEASIIINSVGINLSKNDTVNASKIEIEKTLDVNLFLPLFLSQKYLPFMIHKHWGRIVNVNSIWGFRGSKNNLSYTISKHGLSALTKTIALEYFEFGITANDVCPGPIESKMMDRILINMSKSEGKSLEQTKEEFCNGLRVKRMVTPNEVSAIVAFLCGNDASGINGAAIPVDGGLTI